jgi:hypothetical protein
MAQLMKNTRMFRRFLLVAIPLVLAAPAWAVIMPACPSNPTTNALTVYQPPDPATGCQVLNVQFSNFAVGTDAGDTIAGHLLGPNTVPLPGPANVLLTTALGSFAGIELSPSPANLPNGKGFCKSNSGSSGWCIQGANMSLASSVTFQMVAVNGISMSSLDLLAGVDVHASGSGLSLGASALVFQEICPGVLVFSQGCTGYQAVQVGLFNSNNQHLDASGFSSFAPTTEIAVRETVYLFTHGGEGSFADVDAFDVLTPEPATFGLVGLALAGLGALRIRKRKA